MKESKTTYSYLIEHMQNPSFQKVWDIAYDFVRKLPSDLCDELHDSLNKGVDVLDSEPLMQMYIYSFGKMHNAKLQYAFEHLHENVVKYNEIEIVDYGCGQGLATICYHDFLLTHNSEQTVNKIILIEPSLMALSRAELLCTRFFPHAEIVAINKQFDELAKTDLILSSKKPTLHLLSNILDVASYNLTHFSQLVKEQSDGDNEYVLVSPMQNAKRVQRLKAFASSIDKTIYFEQYLDKRQLDKDKDWTCAVLLCSEYTKHNKVELDCDSVFEEAKSFCENKDKNSNSDYCKELFYKLQICARFGDAKCQNCIGIWYKDGIGTKQNYIAALEWYRKAAAQGFGAAYSNIAWMYTHGKGVDKDEKKAFDNYLSGAKCNHPHCQMQLGYCYFHGMGVEPDQTQAFFWYNKSAEQDYAPAFNSLAICFYKGYGVEKSLERTIYFLTKAAKADDITAIKNIIKLYKKREGIEYFGDEQFDIFVKAAQMGLKEVLSIFSLDWFPVPTKMLLFDKDYSYEDTYELLLNLIKENGKRDEKQIFVYELSEIHNAFFVFNALKNISLQKDKSIGFYAIFRHHELIGEHYELPPGNSLFPYVHDSDVQIKDIIVDRDESIPSNYITAPLCREAWWEIFLLDNMEYFLPKWDHGNYSKRHVILSHKSTDRLPDEIIKYLQDNPLELEPRIDLLFNNIVRIQCVYYNAWEGLVRWHDYYLFQEIPEGKMKVTRLNSISDQIDILYKYECGLKF